MQTGTTLVKLFSFVLLSGLSTGIVFAQNYGDTCNPDASIGHTARIGTINGTIHLIDNNNNRLSAQAGSVVPAGATIETAAGSQVELMIEDRTNERGSKLILTSGSVAVLSGGMYCDDLRPIRDEGRWTARNFDIELSAGSLQLELQEAVSYSFNVTIETKNAKMDLRRGRQERVSVNVSAEGLDDRQLIPVMEHPVISRQISGMLYGRSLDDLSERDRSNIQKHAVITAMAMGFVDIDEEAVESNPQIRTMINMMSGGKSFSELNGEQREMLAQVAGSMLIESGEIDPNEVTIYNQPDEKTVISLQFGNFRVYNTHAGYHPSRVVQLEPGMTAVINGYDEPVLN